MKRTGSKWSHEVADEPDAAATYGAALRTFATHCAFTGRAFEVASPAASGFDADLTAYVLRSDRGEVARFVVEPCSLRLREIMREVCRGCGLPYSAVAELREHGFASELGYESESRRTCLACWLDDGVEDRSHAREHDSRADDGDRAAVDEPPF
jgi:hypothetical protein